MKRLLSLASLLLLTACAQTTSRTTLIEYLNQPGMEDMNLPFSAAVRVDNLLFMSGNLGIDSKTGKLVPGGTEAETRQTMENIKAVAERFGSSMDRVVKCTVFLADMSEWGAMNEVYRTYFKNPPARSALGSSRHRESLGNQRCKYFGLGSRTFCIISTRPIVRHAAPAMRAAAEHRVRRQAFAQSWLYRVRAAPIPRRR